MKAIGIVRKIDPMGRIVLPAELREMLEIREGTSLEIFVDDHNILLKTYQPGCIFCDETSGIIEFKGKLICNSCRKNVLSLFTTA